MSTVEKAARDRHGRAISAAADEQLAAIEGLVRELQETTADYRGRSVDWGDIAALRRSRECLGDAVQGFRAAAAVAELSRAAREVASDIRRFRCL